MEGYTHREIAEMMGKTESFSKSQLSRALEQLRGNLKLGSNGKPGDTASAAEEARA